MRASPQDRVAGTTRVIGITLVAGLATASAALASPVAVGGGVDHYSGPGGETTASVLGIVGGELGRYGTVTIAGLRFDDSVVGMGDGFVVALAAPLTPAMTVRAGVTRLIGDGAFRAWRLKTGPVFTTANGASTALSYTHYEDDTAPGAHSDGGIAEIGLPLTRSLGGRLAIAAASLPGRRTATEAQAGVAWIPHHALEFEALAGLAHDGSAVAPIRPGRDGLGGVVGMLGGGGPPEPVTTDTARTDVTLSLGMRVMLP